MHIQKIAVDTFLEKQYMIASKSNEISLDDVSATLYNKTESISWVRLFVCLIVAYMQQGDLVTLYSH